MIPRYDELRRNEPRAYGHPATDRRADACVGGMSVE
jgi:hypothetical protein